MGLLAQTVTTAEYFFDTDPGIGNATSFALTSGTSISENVSVNVDALSLGFHILGVRVQQDDDQWSQTKTSSFYKFTPIVSPETLVAAEYFFDTDPGLGNGTALSITTENTVSSTFTVDASALSTGYHTLTVRVQDDLGQWSVNHTGRFYMVDLPGTSDQIIAAEYFFDDDPGLGEGTALALTAGSELNQTYAIPTEGLSNGFHILTFRTKNELGLWSTNRSGRFFVFTPRLPSNVTLLEYYFDVDPGIGLGQQLTVEDVASLDSSFLVSVPDTLDQGTHNLFVRVKDANGIYSFSETRTFEIITDPIVDDFFPKEGGPGTQVSILGSNFSAVSGENSVKFGDAFVSNILFASMDSLVVEVPDDASGLVSIAVNVGEQIGVSEELYNVDVAVAEGLVAYYPFNGNANDESGSGNDGIVNGATLTIDRFGEVSSAYSFDGVDDIILANPLRPSLNTLSAWINPTSLPSGQFDNTVFTIGDGVDDRLNINISNNYVPVYAVEFTNLNTGVGSNVSVSPSDWTLVTATYDGDFIRIYVNGVLSGESQVGARTINYGGVDILGIGDDGVSNNPPFRGTLDEIRIYNRALTIEEIQALSADRPQEAPVIANQSFSIPENRIAGTAVGTIEASDANNDPLTYVITSGDPSNTFMLVDSTGVLLVNDPTLLDFEVNQSFTLEVSVSDGQNTTQAVITVSVSDIDETVNQPPQLLADTYGIKENRINGLFIARLNAGDPDGDELTFSILSGNVGNAFLVDEDGNLIVNNEDAIDFETNPQFSLLIRVSDGVLSVDESISVFLTDVDESVNQAPQANNAVFSIAENSANGSVVGTLLAGDPDGDELSFAIISGNSGGTFNVTDAGELSVLDSTLLDFEVTPNFSLEVTVSDGQLTIAREVSIFLQDVVENNDPIVVNPFEDVLFQNPGIPTNLTIDLSSAFSDQDGDPLSFTATSSNADVTVEITNTSLSLSNLAETTVVVTASDGVASVSDEFDISINNLPKIIGQIADQTFTEGFQSELINLEDVFADSDTDALTFTAVSSVEEVVNVSIFNDVLTITEIGLGTSIVSVTADDGKGGLATDDFQIVVEKILSVRENSLVTFPNPSTGKITIAHNSKVKFQGILDLAGKQVDHTIRKVSDEEILVDFSSAGQGVYFLEVLIQGEARRIKVAKNN